MTKQEVMDVIVGCAEKLKHVPTFEELVQMTQISHKQIREAFWRLHARAAGVQSGAKRDRTWRIQITAGKIVYRMGRDSAEAQKAA